jgi:aspartyl-tRNA synthetase
MHRFAPPEIGPFPKPKPGGDLMIDAPGPIDPQQIEDAG